MKKINMKALTIEEFVALLKKAGSTTITIEEIRITVPAFLMKDQPLSHIDLKRFPSVGQ